MRTAQYSHLKTVNIDSNIFTQNSPLTRSKIPLQILKSIVQRKRSNQRDSNKRADRYVINLSKNKERGDREQLQSHPSIDDIHRLAQGVELFTTKKHNKTNSEVEKIQSLNLTENNFMRGKQSIHNKYELEKEVAKTQEMRQNLKTRLVEKSQKFNELSYQTQYFRQNSRKVNPYTQQQYAYLTHKQRDQLSQMKKTTRFKRISSITKSYKVSTIELTTPTHHRRPSIQYTPSNKAKSFEPTKRLFEAKKIVQRREPQIVSPSPWQWRMQQSKQILQ